MRYSDRRAWVALAAPIIGIVLLAATAAGGCTSSQARVISARVDAEFGSAPHFEVDVSNGGEVSVGKGAIIVTIMMDPARSEFWVESNLQSDGQPLIGVKGKQVTLWFPPVETVGVTHMTLSGVKLPGTSANAAKEGLTVTFRRDELATATIEARPGSGTGDWQPYVIGSGPVQIRLVFSADACRACTDQALAGLGAEISWTNDRTVALTFPDAPAGSQIPTLHSTDGLYFNFRSQPTLVAFDAETLEMVNICAVPEDAYQAFLSPDASWLLLKTTNGELGGDTAWLVHTSAGAQLELDRALDYGWSGPSTLVRVTESDRGMMERYQVVDVSGGTPSTEVEGTLPEGWTWWSPSVGPGRLAVYVPAPDEAGPDYLTPCDLWLVDLETGAQVSTPSFVNIFLPPSEGTILGIAEFSPDGLMLAAPSEANDGGEIRLAKVGDSGAEVIGAVPVPGVEHLAWSYLSWSPDLRWWLASEKLVATAAPNEVRDLPSSYEPDPYTRGRPYWSPDGKYLARGEWPDWGAVEVQEVATGIEVDLGNGLPCGWGPDGRFYFIFWNNFEQRNRPGEG